MLFLVVFSVHTWANSPLRTLNSLPTIITKPARTLGLSSYASGGEIINDGGSYITESGICYSISPNPTPADHKIISGYHGIASWDAYLFDLMVNKIYYIRAYAINSEGIAYGNEEIAGVDNSICFAQAWNESPSYLQNKAGIHPMIYNSNFYLPQEWQRSTIDSVELVVCETEKSETVSICYYTGGKIIIRSTLQLDLIIREAKTGNIVATKTFYSGYPASCPSTTIYGGGITGKIDYDEVNNWLKIFVTGNPVLSKPKITSNSSLSFCQGGSAILTSNAANGNQWYKDGIAINLATGTQYIAKSSGSYTVRNIINGVESLHSNPIVVTVNPPRPSISANSATALCGTGIVTLTSNAVTGNRWYKNGITIKDSTAKTLTVNSAGKYTVKVFLNGCESLASDSIVVTVNSIPATSSITAVGPTSFCVGGALTLKSNAASGNLWYRDGAEIFNSNAPSLNVTSSGSYTNKVKLIGCLSAESNAIIVKVNPLPITPSIKSDGHTYICQGTTVKLSSNISNGNQWYKDSIVVKGDTTINLIANSAGNYTVKTNLNGCQSLASNSINVKFVNPINIPYIEGFEGNVFPPSSWNIFNPDNSITWKQFSNPGNGTKGAMFIDNFNYSNKGQIDDIRLAGLTIPEYSDIRISFDVAHTASSYANNDTLSVLISNNCFTTFITAYKKWGNTLKTSDNWSPTKTEDWRKEIINLSYSQIQGSQLDIVFRNTTGYGYNIFIDNVSVITLPAKAAISAGSDTSFCEKGSVTLTSNKTTGIQWYKDGVAVSGAIGSTYTAKESGSYTVTVRANGIESLASNAIQVKVNPIPASPIITTNSSLIFCQGANISLTSNASTGNQWYKGGLAINGSIGATLQVTTEGNYTSKVIVNGCESPVSNAIIVKVTPTPPTPIISSKDLQLVSSSISGNQWYKDDVLIVGATGQFYTPKVSGIYTVRVTENNCSSDHSIQYGWVVATRIPDLEELGIKLMPNPVTDKLIIHRGEARSFINVQLFDLLGKELLNRNSSESTIEIDMNVFASGTYIIRLEDKKNKILGKKKVVKL